MSKSMCYILYIRKYDDVPCADHKHRRPAPMRRVESTSLIHFVERDFEY